MSGRGAGEQAQFMALMIERWLDKTLARKLLGFISARKDGERRAEKVLKAYAYGNVTLSLNDKIAYFLVKLTLDKFSNQIGLSQEDIKEKLREGYWRKGLASTLEGLAWKGAKKPFISYAPFLVVWNFTNACNLNCKHCYQRADKPTPDELSTEEAFKAVDEMTDAGVSYIAFSGGEPLYRKDFFQVAKYAKEKDLGIAVATNGTLLDQEKTKKLEDIGCQYIQISIDGKRETHNEMRGSNSYEKALQGVKNAVDSSITVGLAMTVIRDNYKDVEDVINLTEEIGADIFMHYNFIPTGRGEDIVNLDISPDEREELLGMLASESRRRKIKLLSTAPQYGRVAAKGGNVTSMTHFDIFTQEEMGEDIEFLAEFVGGCGCGRLYCAMQPNGDITPCVFLPKVLGNIRNDSFLDIWKNSPVLEKVRKRETFSDNCKSCDSRNICGGCRARAYAYFKDIQGADPGCILNKDKWKQLKN
ncbi:MAG: radical SAM protein [Acidobacteriota bacterium]|nr:radical SAM protein [Acidobacteriota bacterium]